MITELNPRAKLITQKKIKNLEELAALLHATRQQDKRTVLCHGVFDLLHVGHIRHFQEAKQMGDLLVVTLTPDIYVNKGPHRPAFPQELRAEVIASLEMVDYVAINRWPTAIETIKLLRPDIYANGPDYKDAAKDATGNILLEAEAVNSVDGRIVYTDDLTFSSSNLLNRHWSSHSPEVNSYLDAFRKRYTLDAIVHYLETLRSLRVLVVGEAILDEYIYGDTMGKSAKESVLAMRYLRKSIHAGGILAVANHIAEFCDNVELVTYLGKVNAREDFVRHNLKPNIKPSLLYKADSPTIVKRRYVENYTVSKLLEVYEMNDELLNENEDKEFCDLLEDRLGRYDLAIVADYGHGLIGPRAANLLSSQARFLAVNTQINASNIGFHTISKYPKADYVCIHEGELRLDCRKRKDDAKKLTSDLAKRLECHSIMVTQGKRGTLFYNRENHEFFSCPAFATKVVDRIGAGDAVLALTSLCAARNLPPDVVGFLGNVAGSQAVAIVGNESSLNRVQIIKTVESLLK